jgi:NAD(P)-dependent dehydrogenase (short-subunit alcohol dehydrogenase family)
VLVNNAGIAGAAPIDQYSPADWEKMVAVTSRAPSTASRPSFRR